MLSVIIIIGILFIGALAVLGGRRQREISHWTVGGRDLPKWTSWFLQAGESLTTFSFLGLAGIAYGGGVSALFALVYLSICSAMLYFVAPRLRVLGADRGYLTMADFFGDRFQSKALSVVVAIVGAIFLIPLLQLQITGLGLVVQLATGSSSASGLSMIVASTLVVVFVIWAGIRGIARVAVFKDFAMLLAFLIVLLGIVVTIGGVPEVFARVGEAAPQLMTVTSPGLGTTFFISATVVTSIGAGFNTFPHLWPPIPAAKSGAVLRSNYTWLPLYQLLLFVPILVGMAGVLVLAPKTAGNSVLLGVAEHTLPDWLVAVIAVAGASAAMVPAAAIAMGISSLIANNVFTIKNPALRFRVNHAVVVLAVGLALLFGLAKSDIASLLLLSYGGLTQLAPAIAVALPKRVSIGAFPVLLGIVTGTLCVAVLTFTNIPLGEWDSGLVSLAPNLVVAAVAEVVRRYRIRTSGVAGCGAGGNLEMAGKGAP